MKRDKIPQSPIVLTLGLRDGHLVVSRATWKCPWCARIVQAVGRTTKRKTLAAIRANIKRHLAERCKIMAFFRDVPAGITMVQIAEILTALEERPPRPWE